TRKYIAIKIEGKTTSSVSKAMEYLKNYYGDKFSQIFKTITSDNGSEFAELAKLEDNTKTKVYFAHPYSSWERG
ncbi:IS30 family transposase, partial [Acinetobacter baumannii]|nr:IS30 family transposase [Acinetobacter baumannii]